MTAAKRNLIEKKVDLLEDTIRKKIEAASNFGDEDHRIRLLNRIFRYYDAENRGIVNFKDFFAVMTKSNFVGVQREVENLFNRYDEDNTGHIDYLEFCKEIFGKGKRTKYTPAQADIVNKIRASFLRKAGMSGMLFLKTLRNYQYVNYDGQNYIDGQVFGNIIRKHVYMNSGEIDYLFDVDGKINLDSFLAEVFKGMSLDRKQLVSSVFRRLDEGNRNYVTVEEVSKAYRFVTNNAPSVKGQVNATGDSLQQILYYFTDNTSPEPEVRIAWRAFLDYYRAISAAVDVDDDFDIIVRSSWYFEPGVYVGRTSLARASSPSRGASRGGPGSEGLGEPAFPFGDRPSTSSGARPFGVSTMKNDFNYKPRPQSSGRVGNIMDGNFNCTRSKANYKDGFNGYFRDPLQTGPCDYTSPRFEKKYSSRDQAPRSITTTDFTYTGPLKTQDTRFLTQFGGQSPVLTTLGDNGYMVGPTVYPHQMPGFSPPGSPELKDLRTTTNRDYTNRRGYLAPSREPNGLYSRPTTGLRSLRGTREGPYETRSAPHEWTNVDHGFSRPATRAGLEGTHRDGKFASNVGFATTDNPTVRRVLVIHTDGSEETVDLVDELGTTRFDSQYLLAKLTEQGIVDISDIRL